MQKNHLVERFWAVASKQGDAPLFHEKKAGAWHATSYGEMAHNSKKLAKALQELGLKTGERVILCASNSANWALCDLAIMAAGAIVVPAYTTHTLRDHEHQIADCSPSILICSAGDIQQALLSAAENHDGIKAMIVLGKENNSTPSPENMAFPIYNLKDLLARTAFEAEEELPLTKGGAETSCIIYTSGTGGYPKGVMLTHDSIQANIDAAKDLLDEGRASTDAVFLSLLPLSHAYEHTAGLHLAIQIGGQVYFCEGADKIGANLAEVRPTLMTAVPRLYEVLYERITKNIEAKGGISARLFYKALELGRKRWAGTPLSFTEHLLDLLLDRLVRRKVKARLGGRLKYFVSGGAALNSDIGTFFLGLGVNILQGYGQTEASPLISANRPGDIRIETVGPAVRGVEVKLGRDGELLAKGRCLMKGYWRNPNATAQTIQNGWLYTGDLAEISEDGFITITGRKKDMIVNSGGDNIAPQRVEAEYLLQPEIAQIMISGNKKPWLAAVIVPSEQIAHLTKNDQSKHIKLALDRCANRLAKFEQVRKFVIADSQFSIQNNQLTPTLKVKRHIVAEHYKQEIEQLYT